jgi:DNA-binding response OmpR family regulator
MYSILLLEDDEVLSETLIDLLENEGFTITHVTNANSALDATFNNCYDLFLFDVNIEGMSGFELLRELRESADKTAAIFITALTDIASLSKGFDVGADDYLKKPFDFDELLVRIHALLRKKYASYKNRIAVNEFSFNIKNEELEKDGKFIPLSPLELKLTKILFENLNKTVNKEHIFEQLRGELSDGSLRVHINKLRKVGLPIKTLKGIGYRLVST